jgi:SH3 domain
MNKPRARARAAAHAHAYAAEDEPTPAPPTPDPVRPVISTKYRTSPPPTPSPSLRRIQTDPAAAAVRPYQNGNRVKKVMRVEHAFDAESDSEMSIVPGELISVLEEVDAGWFIGEIVGDESRRQGMFPATYCSVVETISAPALRRPPKPPSPTARSDASSVSGGAGDLDDQISNLSIRKGGYNSAGTGSRPGVTRSQTASVAATTLVGGMSTSPNIVMAKKKAPPPPPVSRGNKPIPGFVADGKCRECGCIEFRANVFKKGSCNNCFHVHGL